MLLAVKKRVFRALQRFASNCQVSIVDTCYFQKLDRFDAISAAGAIYVEQGSFTQSGGTLTITDASAGSDGGAVRMLRNPFILAVLSRGFPCWVTSWIFSESFCRHPMQSIVLCFQTEAET